MKVLFCTPYLTGERIVSGGIGIWANNILDYYKTLDSDVTLIPLPFDRRYNVSKNSTTFDRFFYGLKDYWRPIRASRKLISEVDVIHLCSSAQLSLYKDLYILRMAKRHHVKWDTNIVSRHR